MIMPIGVSIRFLSLKKGFSSLSAEDKEFLRVWFRIPAKASDGQACRILARRAPSRILDDIRAVGLNGTRSVPSK